jgi:flagellar motor switch protein FliM
MADDNLTENEVHVLLQGVEDKDGLGAEESLEGSLESDKRSFSFGSQERIVRGRMPTMETIHERFIRLLRISTSNLFGELTEVKVAPTATCKYSDFVSKHSLPTNINLIKMKPLRGTGLLVIDPDLVMYVVDNLFGGGSRFPVSLEGREFTSTEQRIIVRLLELFFASYETAWTSVHRIQCEHVSSEMNLNFVNIAMPSELMSITTFTITAGGRSFDLDLCLPYLMLEPIMDLLVSQMQGALVEQDDTWAKSLLSQVDLVELELVASLGKKSLTLEDIMALKAGDTIPLVFTPIIPVTIDSMPVLMCRYGIFNNQYALKVEKLLKPDGSEFIKGEHHGQ